MALNNGERPKGSIPRFETPDQILEWLISKEGFSFVRNQLRKFWNTGDIREKFLKYLFRKIRTRRQHVVIEVSHDGFIRVFARKHVSVKFVNLMRVSSPEAEILNEDLEYSRMSKKFQTIYLNQTCLRGTWMIQDITPKQLVRNLNYADTVRYVDEVFREIGKKETSGQ